MERQSENIKTLHNEESYLPGVRRHEKQKLIDLIQSGLNFEAISRQMRIKLSVVESFAEGITVTEPEPEPTVTEPEPEPTVTEPEPEPTVTKPEPAPEPEPTVTKPEPAPEPEPAKPAKVERALDKVEVKTTSRSSRRGTKHN